MKTLWTLGLSLAALVLMSSVHAATSTTTGAVVKETRRPIAELAMDGSRVVYASGLHEGIPNGSKVYVWNTRTGKTTLVRGKYSSHVAELAIAGTRVALITRYVVGNSMETTERLYAGSLTARERLLASGRHSWIPDTKQSRGRWIAGAVGSGGTLAVSTWWSHLNGTSTAQRLSLITPTGLRPIATGAGTIMAAATDGGHIAVLRSRDAWPQFEPTPAPSIGIYSTSGKLLREITLPSVSEVALSGNELVVLTETKELAVYDWPTGTLLRTWPVAASTPRLTPGHLAASGRLAVYSVDPRRSAPRKLHLVDLTTGKDVVLATGKGAGYWSHDAALGPRGLVYTVNSRDHGKLVFVPTAKLLAKVS